MKCKIQKTIRSIGFMLQFCNQINRSIFLPTIIVMLLQTASTVSLVLLPRYVIDDLAQKASWNDMLPSIAMLIGIIFGIQFLQKLFLPWHAKEVNTSDVKTGLHYDQLFANTEYENQKSNLVRNSRQKLFYHIHVNTFISLFFDECVQSFLYLAIFSGLFIKLNIWIFIVMVISVILNYLIDLKKKKDKYHFEKISANSKRKIDYLASVLTNFENAKELRVNSATDYFLDKYDIEFKEYKDKNDALVKKEIIMGLLENAIYFVFQLLVYIGIAFMLFHEQITIGEMTMYISAVLTFYRYAKSFFSAVGALCYYRVYVEDYQLFVDNLLEKHGPKKEMKSGIESKPRQSFEIEFKHVSFQYPGSQQYALKNVTIRIRSREKIALVGLNGAGKTTFIQLLCRLYRPTEGKITLNGIDIFEYSHDDYMKYIAVVFQDYRLFSFSMKENIILAQTYQEQKFVESLQKSHFQEVIDHLEQGVDTSLTKEFDDNGSELSGGEAERLAMARALYRDAPILILDEPTAAVDAIAERKFYEELSEIAENKTAIFISHRLSSAKFCDTIIVFDHGSIVSNGKHDNLMDEHGIYQKMFSRQAVYYDSNEFVFNK